MKKQNGSMVYASRNGELGGSYSEHLTVVSYDEALATDARDEQEDILYDPEDDN